MFRTRRGAVLDSRWVVKDVMGSHDRILVGIFLPTRFRGDGGGVLVLNLTIVVEKGALGVDTGPLDWADLATIRVTEEVALAVDLQPGRIDGV